MGDEINARFDRLRHRYHSFNRADRLLSSLAGGDAGALKTRIGLGRSRELILPTSISLAIANLGRANSSEVTF